MYHGQRLYRIPGTCLKRPFIYSCFNYKSRCSNAKAIKCTSILSEGFFHTFFVCLKLCSRICLLRTNQLFVTYQHSPVPTILPAPSINIASHIEVHFIAFALEIYKAIVFLFCFFAWFFLFHISSVLFCQSGV
jgi:hypothetical protein